MTSSFPWLKSLTDFGSVTDTTLFDPDGQVTYTFSDKFSKLTVSPLRTKETLVEDLHDHVRPICFATDVNGIAHHNSGILCWKTKIEDALAGSFTRVVVWLKAGVLRREEKVIFTSKSLLNEDNRPIERESVVSLLKQIQSVCYVDERRFLLNTGEDIFILEYDSHSASLSPLYVSTIPTGNIIDNVNKHLLKFVDFRPSHRANTFLLVMYSPFSTSQIDVDALVLSADGQLIIIEVGLSFQGKRGRFTQEDGMVSAKLPSRQFTHDTVLQIDQNGSTYLFAIADVDKLEVCELHTVPAHAMHTADTPPGSATIVQEKQGILRHFVATENTIPTTLRIITYRADQGLASGHSYEVMVQSRTSIYRMVNDNGKLYSGEQRVA